MKQFIVKFNLFLCPVPTCENLTSQLLRRPWGSLKAVVSLEQSLFSLFSFFSLEYQSYPPPPGSTWLSPNLCWNSGSDLTGRAESWPMNASGGSDSMSPPAATFLVTNLGLLWYISSRQNHREGNCERTMIFKQNKLKLPKMMHILIYECNLKPGLGFLR